MPDKNLLKRAKTSSYTTKQIKVTTQWLKNATRSLGGNALETLSEVAPNIYSVAETSAKLAKQVTKSGTAESIGQKISGNRYVSLGRTSIKNALKDLRQGNFGNSDRDESDDDESTRYNFGEDGGEEETDASQTPIFVNIEGMDTVNDAITTQTKYQLKSAQATTDTMVATSSAVIAANQKNADAAISLLTNIDNSLQSLVKYQNENMTKFIQASMTYYENVGKANAEKTSGEKEVNTADVFDPKSGKFSVDKYGELIKKNVLTAIKESDIGIVGTMIDSFGDDLAKNPLKYITKAVMDKAIPSAIKAATESVDKTFGNFIGEYIMKQSENLKGKDNFLARFFGKALDLNIDRKKELDLSGKITTDAAVFDGITRNAITAEIPKYLRESNAYLRKLVELSGGDPDSAVANSRIYNKETGLFERYEDYTKNLLDSINQSVIKTFSDSEFGQSMNKVAEAEELGNRQQEFTELLNKFYLALEKDERQRIDITKKGVGSDLNEIISGLTGKEDIKKILEDAVYSSFNNKQGGMNLNVSRMAAKNARNQQLEYLENNRAIDLAESIGTDTNADNIAARVTSSPKPTKDAKTSLSYLRRIESLLQRGINVRMTGNEPYEEMKFGDNGNMTSSGETQDTSSNKSEPSNITASIDNLDFKNIISRGDVVEEPKGEKSKYFVKGAEGVKEAMHALIRGDKEGFSKSMKGVLGTGTSATWDKIKNSDAAKSVNEFLHGKKDEDGNTKEKGMIDKIKDQFKSGMTSISKTFFGEDGDIDKLKEEAVKKAKEVAPAALKGAAFGIGTGGVLGSLIGGPVVGALMGTAGHFITKSETFQHVLYGDLVDELDENGNKTGNKVRNFTGIIDKKTADFMKKNKGILTAGGVGGAAIGAMTGGGILGSLVGGPIAGAFLGTAATAIAKSDTFQEFIFGKKDPNDPDNEKRIGGIMGMFRNAFGNPKDDDRNALAKAGGGAAAGAGLGLLASFFTPIGPVGGAIAGLGASMYASKDKFKEMLFGKKDKDGNKTSKGLVGEIGTRMQREVIAPLAGIAGEALMSAKDAVMDHILDPIMNLAEPIIGLAGRIYDKVTDKLDKLLETVGGGIKKIIGKGFGLLGKGVGFLFKKIFGDKEHGIVGGAMKIGGSIGNFVGDRLRNSNERASRKKFFSDRYQSSEAGQKAMQDARDEWNSMTEEKQAEYKGYSDFLRKFAGKKFYNAGDGRDARIKAKQQRAEDRANRRKTNKENLLREKMISQLTKGKYGEDSPEARRAALNKLKGTRAYINGRDKFGGYKMSEIEKLLTPENTDAAQEAALDKEQLEETIKQTTAVQRGFEGVKSVLGTGFNAVVHALGATAALPFKGIGAAANAIGDKMDAAHEKEVAKESTASEAAQRSNAKDIERMKVNGSLEYMAGIDLKKKTFGKFSRSLEHNMKKVLEDKRVSQDSELYKMAKVALDEDANMVDRYKAERAFPRLYKEFKANTKEQAKNYAGLKKSYFKNARRAGLEDARESLSSMFRRTKGVHYATGTENAQPGDAVVGEQGPEIVRFGGGEKVVPNNKAIDVNLVSVSTGALQRELEDATVDVNLTGQDGVITTYSTGAKLDENTDNKSTIEKKLAKPDALVDYSDIKADNGDEDDVKEKKEKNSFFDLLKGIGGGIVDIVKGILPMGLGIAGLWALFQNGGAVKEVIDRIGSGIESVSDFFKKKDKDKDATTAGVNAITSIADIQADSLTDYINPLGDLNHNTKDAAGNSIKNVAATEAKNELTWKQGLRNQLLGTGTIGKSLNTFASNRALNSATRWDTAAQWSKDHIGGVGSKWMEKKSNKKLAQAEKFEEKANSAENNTGLGSLGRNAARVGTIYGVSNAAGAGAKGIAKGLGMSDESAQTVGDVATMATSGALTVNMAKSAAKGKKSLVDKLIDGVMKMMTWIGKKLAKTKAFKKLGENAIVSGFKNLGKKVSEGIQKGFTDKIQKLATMKLADCGVKSTAAIASLGVSTVIGGLGGLASGLCSTEHLFGVLPGDADAGMTAISGILGTIFGALETLPGLGWIVALFDVIDAILIGIPEISLKLGDWEITFGGVGIKQTIARFIYRISGGNANLEEAQKAFQDEKQYYADTYGVEMNDATFNDMVNNSGLIDKLWHGGVKKGEDGHLDYDEAGKVLHRGGIRGTVLGLGAEHAYAKDENGNIIKNADGKAVVAKDAYGHDIYKDKKWGNYVGDFFHNAGRFFAGGDIYETDENGNAIVDKDGNYVVKEKEGNIFEKAAGLFKKKELRKPGEETESGNSLKGILKNGTKGGLVSSITDSIKNAVNGAKAVTDKTNETTNTLVNETEKSFDATISRLRKTGDKMVDAMSETGFGKITKGIMDIGKRLVGQIHKDGDELVGSLGKSFEETVNYNEKLTGTLAKTNTSILSTFSERIGSTFKGFLNDESELTKGEGIWGRLKTELKKNFKDDSGWKWDGGSLKDQFLTGGKGGIPFYSQKDPRWANMEYEEGGSGVNKETIADAGCGPAAFAMAASGATGANINPVESAEVMQSIGARDETGTNWKGIGKAASAYGIDTKMSMSPSESFIDNELDAGNPVVLSGRSGGYGDTPYTSQGHYVVATGKDSRGNYIINDPNSRSGPRKFNKSAIVNETGAAWGFGGKKQGGKGAVQAVMFADGSSTTSNGGNTASESTGTGVREKWVEIISAVKQAIAQQQPGYSQQNWITITIGGKSLKVRTDCSGYVAACLKFFGVMDDGQNLTSYLTNDPNNQVMKSTGFTPSGWIGWDELQNGDIISKGGHVEIFAWNKDGQHYVWNCGSDKSTNSPVPTVTGHKEGYATVWSPDGANAGKAIVNCDITASDGSIISTGSNNSGSNSSNATSSGGGFFSKLTSFFTELGSRAVEGATTGHWNTDWSGFFNGNNSGGTTSDGVSGGSTSGGVSGSSDIAAANVDPSDVAKSVWNFFTQNGYSKEATAGIMGNLQAESGMNPARKQDGGPAAGIAQWENYSTQSGRWAQLRDYAASKGKDWTDLGSQLEFVHKELQGLNSYFSKDIPYGGNIKGSTLSNAGAVPTTYEEWKQSKDVDMATRQFEGAFERAGIPHMDNRVAAAKGYYNLYANQSTDTAQSTGGASPTAKPEMGTLTDEMALRGYGGKGHGKKFGGKGMASVDGSIMQSNMMSNIESGVISHGKQQSYDLSSVCRYLGNILNVLTQSNGKLDALNMLGNLSTSTDGFNGTIQQNVFTSNQSPTPTTGAKGGRGFQLEKTNESKFQIASRIASGGL